MSGLETLLDQVDRQTDATMRRLGMSAPAVTDGTAEGRFTLPGLIALLAVGAQDRPRHSLAAEVITPATIERALDEIGRLRGVPIRASEAREVVELLTTGEVIVDVAAGLRAALLLAPRLPLALTRDALALPELPRAVVDAIHEDFWDDPPHATRRHHGPPRRPAGRPPAHSHQHPAGPAGPGGSRRARRDDPGAHRAREPDAAACRARLRADPGHRPR